MAKRRADVLSLADLSKAVDRAVALAAKRHDVKTEPASLMLGWEIFGRRLRAVADLEGAFAFASDVTKGVKIRGLKVEPVVAKIGPDVLCGFIERGQLLRQFGR